MNQYIKRSFELSDEANDYLEIMYLRELNEYNEANYSSIVSDALVEYYILMGNNEKE